MAATKFTIIARTFSSSAAQSQLVKTPVSVFGIGGRYASAIYSAGVKAKDIDKIEPDFLKLNEVLTKDKRFKEIIKDPTIKRSQKALVMKEAANKLSFSTSATNAIVLLAENGRLKDFDLIFNALKIIMAAHRGEVTCEVISAKPLTDAQKKDVEAALKKFTKGKETILMTSKVDPKIIGGLIVLIGDKYVDMSIASKIKKYTDIMKSVV